MKTNNNNTISIATQVRDMIAKDGMEAAKSMYNKISFLTLSDIADMKIMRINGEIPLSFGHRFHRGNYHRYTVDLKWEVVPAVAKHISGKKNIIFPKNWNNRHFDDQDFKDHHNAIAIKTGGDNGPLVIDFDNDGVQYFKKYELDKKQFPTVKTPNGIHVYLNNEHVEYFCKKYNVKNLTTTCKRINVDIRHTGACAFSPNTVIDGYGEYVWIMPPCKSRLKHSIQDIEPLLDEIFLISRESKKIDISNNVIETANSITDYYNDWEKARYVVSILSKTTISYGDWICIGLSLRAGFGDLGKELWDMFLHNPNYQDTQRYLDAKWLSFGRIRSTTLGTLFHIAKQYGIY